MALTNNFIKDMYVLYEGVVHYVMDRMYKTQGRQGGLIILKMRNMNTGNLITITLKAGMKLEEVDVITKEMQYLYTDNSGIYFMDTETFETITISKEIVGSYVNYLKEGDKMLTIWYGDKILDIKRNPSVILEVKDAQDAVKGNTATNAMKEVKVETGYIVRVPMFINKGDKITINTDTGDYTGRVN